MSEEQKAPETKTDEQIAIERLQGKITDTPEEKPDEKPQKTPDEKPDENPEEKPDENKGEEIKPEFFEKLTGGRFKTADEFNSHLTEHEELKKTADAYKMKVSELEKISAANPFEDQQDLYRISQLSKKIGSKDYGAIGRLSPESLTAMNDLEVLKLDEILSDPDYQGKEHLLDRRLSKKYLPQKPEDFDEEDPKQKEKYNLEVEEKEFELKKEAKKVREKYSKMWNEVEMPVKKTEEQIKAEYKQREDRIISDWRNPITETKQSLTKIEMEIPVDKGKVPVTIEVPEAMAAEIDKVLRATLVYIFNNDLKATPDVIAKVKDMAQKSFISENLGFVTAQIAKQVRMKSEQDWISLTQNPSALRTDKGKKVEQDLTDEEKRVKEMQQGK